MERSPIERLNAMSPKEKDGLVMLALKLADAQTDSMPHVNDRLTLEGMITGAAPAYSRALHELLKEARSLNVRQSVRRRRRNV